MLAQIKTARLFIMPNSSLKKINNYGCAVNLAVIVFKSFVFVHVHGVQLIAYILVQQLLNLTFMIDTFCCYLD